MIDAEKELKGCLIRKGKFYFNAGKSETLVIKDDMTLSVLPVFGASERILLDHGVRDTYGFGPTLVENGQIAAVLVVDAGNDAATLKRFYHDKDSVTLMPANPAYPPQVFTGDAANRVKILGVATHFISKLP